MDAPGLLRVELTGTAWRPRPVRLACVPDSLAGVDPYPSVEERLRLTRQCLELLCELRAPVELCTRNHLVMRDADVLAHMVRHSAARVVIPLETLTARPRTAPSNGALVAGASSPAQRLHAMYRLAGMGVPVGVLLSAPSTAAGPESRSDAVPFERELPAILEAACGAGARWATLAGGHETPGHLLRAFQMACARNGLAERPPALSTQAFRPERARQLQFFATAL